jgi:hypothetical protein
MTEAQMWNDWDPVKSLKRPRLIYQSVTVPPWINFDISPATIVAIVRSGVGSGAYMPAVTYCEALDTMSKHGDRVFDYLADHLSGELLVAEDLENISWSGLACRYLSRAVELWAQNAYATLKALDDA